MGTHTQYRNRAEVRQHFRHVLHRAGASGSESSPVPELPVGTIYRISHEAMGTFEAVVLDDLGSHAVVEVTEGYARRPGGKTWGVGERFSVLKIRARFEPRVNV